MTHSFTKSAAKTKTNTALPWLRTLYKTAFPAMIEMIRNEPGSLADRQGVDLVLTTDANPIGIDEKFRGEEYDDVLLEFWSDRERRQPGWVAKDLRTDVIAYIFKPSRSCLMIPFPALREAWKQHHKQWVINGRSKVGGFSSKETLNEENRRKWTTEWVAVPIPVLRESVDGIRRIEVEAESTPSPLSEFVRTCHQCNKPHDGTEREVWVCGLMRWLHPACEPTFMARLR